jgi:cytochrome c553
MQKMTVVFALALLSSGSALALDKPDWAFPSNTGLAPVERHDDGKPKQVAGSTKTYTQKEIDSFNNPPDWFPNEHAPLPQIVAHGRDTQVRACIGCHLATGQGHPENSRLPGGTPAYLTQQLHDMKNGVRKGAGGAMFNFAKAMTEEEIKDAVNYFGNIKPMKWTRVVESATVPKTYYEGGRRLQHPQGGTEPIGNRIIEVPEDPARVELRDPHSGFIAYVPPGSIAKGQLLVATGGDGKTVACTICHGPTLQGLGDVPAIAGQAPGTVARQMYFISTGDRNGPWAQLMKQVVAKLSNEDLINIAAYVGSLDP